MTVDRIEAHRVSPSSKYYYVPGLGIRGTRTDIKRWAKLCHPGSVVVFVK